MIKLIKIDYKEFVKQYLNVLQYAGVPFGREWLLVSLSSQTFTFMSKFGRPPNMYMVEANPNYFFPFIETDDYYSGEVVLTHPLELRCKSLADLYSATLSELYHDFNSVYGDDKTASVWPMVGEEQIKEYGEFSDYLKKAPKMKFHTHFFGTKSDVVKWDTVSGSELSEDDVTRMMELEAIHCADYAKRFDQPVDMGFFHPLPIETTVRSTWVLARDMQRLNGSNIVCAMQLIETSNCINADRIMRDTDEKYKPYSLVLCAQLEAVRYAAFSCNYIPAPTPLNLGLNMDNKSYKDAIPHEGVPIKTMRHYPADATLEQIEVLLQQTAICLPQDTGKQ